ncbi:MAG: DUF2442 domain-containing protein [Candidatus Omnitrophica bacterium]|nr:DUF2442 domain-containing protein [Candidatus Omnitrophota bacterium]
MSTSVLIEAKAEEVKVTSRNLIVTLVDGRKLEVPLVWFPCLLRATPAQRNKYRLIGDGIGIHWPAIDEDLSIEGLIDLRRPLH